MHHYRQALLRMRQGDSDRKIAAARVMGRPKAAQWRRIATVESVFANLRHNKRLGRFTLRGKDKVGTQWRLFCRVHNIEKVTDRGDWA